MLKIGITGSMGSGKSTVAFFFHTLGVHIYNSDVRAKELMTDDENLKQKIKNSFGDDTYTSTGTLDRSRLAKIVFNDKEKISLLNSLVHPAVQKDFDEWCKKFSQEKYILKEAALLVESGSYKTLDKLICVTAPEEIRIARCIKRDGISREEIIARMKNQLSENEKIIFADYIISNDESELLIPQLLKLHEEFLN